MPLSNISSNDPLPLAPKSKKGKQIYLRHEDRSKPLENRIVLAICRYYTDKGTTIKQIVRQSLLSRNTVRKALKSLAKSEDVKQTEGKWLANDYDTGHKGFKVRLIPGLKKYEYCVLGLLRSWATNGRTTLTQQGIATQLGISRRTVYKTVKSLVGDDWIQQRDKSFELLKRTQSVPANCKIESRDEPKRSDCRSEAQRPTTTYSSLSPEDQAFIESVDRRMRKEASEMMRRNGISQKLIDEQLAILQRYGIEIWNGWKACFAEAESKHRPKQGNDPKHCGYLLRTIVKRLIKPRSNTDTWEDVCRSDLFNRLCYLGTSQDIASRVAARYPKTLNDITRKRLMAMAEPLLTDDLSDLLSSNAA